MGGEGIHNPADVDFDAAYLYLGYIYTVCIGIQAEVAGLDGDAMRGTDGALLAASYTAERGTDDATLQATWTDAMATALANYTAARAGYLDELAAANLPTDIAAIIAWIGDILYDLSIVEHETCNRIRIYPREPSEVISINSDAAADTWGDWTEVVPINTIGFEYQPVGVMVENVDAVATYMIQFGYSTVDGDDPVTSQTVGEQRWPAFAFPLKAPMLDLFLQGRECPTNSKLWARIKTETTNVDNCVISITIARHVPITNELGHLATWPWAT